MNDTKEELIEQVSARIRTTLGSYVGKVNNEVTKDQVRLAMKKSLAKMEAQLYGYHINSMNTLWETFDTWQKTKWFFCNKIMGSIAKKEQKRVDKVNEDAYMEAYKEYVTDGLDEDEDSYFSYDRLDYPWWAEPNPKGILKIDYSIQPKQGLDYVTFSGVLDQIQKEA